MRFVSTVLLLIAVLVRFVVPDGYMPTVTEAGTYQIVICTSDGTAKLTIDANGNPVEHSDGEQNDICPFAISVAAIVAPEQPLPVLVRAVTTRRATWPATDQLILDANLSPSVARAPPLTV